MDRAPRSWSWVQYRLPYSSSSPSYYSHALPQGEAKKEEWKTFFLALYKRGCFCIIGTFLPEGPCDAGFCLQYQEHPGEALMRKHRGEERRGGAYQAGREFLADVGVPVNSLGWKRRCWLCWLCLQRQISPN